jgi:hypothetical protein
MVIVNRAARRRAPRWEDTTAGGRYPTAYTREDVRYWLTRGLDRETAILAALRERAANRGPK